MEPNKTLYRKRIPYGMANFASVRKDWHKIVIVYRGMEMVVCEEV